MNAPRREDALALSGPTPHLTEKTEKVSALHLRAGKALTKYRLAAHSKPRPR
jgi:hypothetical protein